MDAAFARTRGRVAVAAATVKSAFRNNRGEKVLEASCIGGKSEKNPQKMWTDYN